ncbi:hypothetical protein D4764_06G0005570 [Takifugu flavidus]|uniref:Uncharacterized protein n=1 Tax=Takifugu flavidus TaxID=433684 RepID=A0A5C6N034_9TELE|nr:hypothetical protein D4764_06G0005570 [Takifugu flavidus]
MVKCSSASHPLTIEMDSNSSTPQIRNKRRLTENGLTVTTEVDLQKRIIAGRDWEMWCKSQDMDPIKWTVITKKV